MVKLPTEDEPAVVVEGDCLEVMRGLPDGCVDAVVTDPPYFLPATHYSLRSKTYRSLSDLSILEHYFRDVFRAAARLLKPTGFLYAFCDGQSYPVFYATAYPFVHRLRPLVWDKRVSVNGFAWRHQHELILFAEMPESPAVKTGDGDVLDCRAVPVDDREHLAQKPVELLRRLIEKTTPKGGVVFDPFAGSASTGIAAMAVGCRFLGIEKDPGYVEIARRRIGEANGEGGLFAPKPSAPDLFPEPA